MIEKQISDNISNQIEIDEMWHYIQNKGDKCWIWLAICKVSKLILGFVTGSRGYKTGKKLFQKINKFTHSNTIYYTDYWESYEKFIPPNQHYQGKDQTYTIEGYNSNFRDDLQRLTRRTKAYSKSQDMLNHSLYLYIVEHNTKQLKRLDTIKGV
jgi:insertion element IS1 protein InsB